MDILPIILQGFILAIFIVVMYKIELRRLKNKVHFYVARDKNGVLVLFFGKPFRNIEYWEPVINCMLLAAGNELNLYGLDIKDYDNLKWEDEPVEVFLNLQK